MKGCSVGGKCTFLLLRAAALGTFVGEGERRGADRDSNCSAKAAKAAGKRNGVAQAAEGVAQ